MDCNEYIESYLSAHADGELAPDQLRDAEVHLAGCPRCTAELEGERALKALLREHIGVKRIPAPIEERIRTAVAAEPVRTRPRATTLHRGSTILRRRATILGRRPWIPMAIAAALLVTLMTAHMMNRRTAVAMFNLADDKLDTFTSEFEPNIPSESPAEVESAYRTAGMPSHMWDFTAAGYKMEGGRIETMPDGRRVTYTLYRGPFGASILCMRMNGIAMRPPPGAVMQSDDYQCYRYNKASICLSYGPKKSFTCILITHEPVEHLMNIVSESEAAKHDD